MKAPIASIFGSTGVTSSGGGGLEAHVSYEAGCRAAAADDYSAACQSWLDAAESDHAGAAKKLAYAYIAGKGVDRYVR